MGKSTKVEDGTKEIGTKKKTYSYRQFRKMKSEKNAIETTKFVGMCSAIPEHVYDCLGAGQVEQYTKATEKITEYVGSEYTMGSDIETAIETPSPSTSTILDDPDTDASKIELFMW